MGGGTPERVNFNLENFPLLLHDYFSFLIEREKSKSPPVSILEFLTLPSDVRNFSCPTPIFYWWYTNFTFWGFSLSRNLIVSSCLPFISFLFIFLTPFQPIFVLIIPVSSCIYREFNEYCCLRKFMMNSNSWYHNVSSNVINTTSSSGFDCWVFSLHWNNFISKFPKCKKQTECTVLVKQILFCRVKF